MSSQLQEKESDDLHEERVKILDEAIAVAERALEKGKV